MGTEVIKVDWTTYIDWTTYGVVLSYATLAVLLAYIVHSLLLGRVFKKAKLGYWRAWVPIVRDWTFFKAGGYKGANVFWGIGAVAIYVVSALFITFGLDTMYFIVSGIGLGLGIVYCIFYIAAIISLQKKLGKPLPFVILYFVNLVAPLWLWILALDNSKYNAKKGHVSSKK